MADPRPSGPAKKKKKKRGRKCETGVGSNSHPIVFHDQYPTKPYHLPLRTGWIGQADKAGWCHPPPHHHHHQSVVDICLRPDHYTVILYFPDDIFTPFSFFLFSPLLQGKTLSHIDLNRYGHTASHARFAVKGWLWLWCMPPLLS